MKCISAIVFGLLLILCNHNTRAVELSDNIYWMEISPTLFIERADGRWQPGYRNGKHFFAIDSVTVTVDQVPGIKGISANFHLSRDEAKTLDVTTVKVPIDYLIVENDKLAPGYYLWSSQTFLRFKGDPIPASKAVAPPNAYASRLIHQKDLRAHQIIEIGPPK